MQRTLRMCDTPECDRAATGACVICRSDRCGVHMTWDLRAEVQIRRSNEIRDSSGTSLGTLCNACAENPITLRGHAHVSAVALLDSLKDPLIEILRAHQVAEAVK